MTTQKTWWAPIWRGLVADAEGKHCRRMKNAIWLYLHFLLHADRRSGQLKRKCRTVAEEMGLPEATIRKWLAILKRHGYVEVRSTGRCLEVVINKWKTLPQSPDLDSQNDQTGTGRLLQDGQSHDGEKPGKTFTAEGKMSNRAVANDSELKKTEERYYY